MRYLSAGDISALALSPKAVEQIAERTVRGLGNGTVIMAPRPVIQAASGTRFMAFPAILEDEGVAGVKWLGISPFHTKARRQSTASCIALSSTDDSTLLALVDARWITAIRTATVSLMAARRLAPRESRRIAFIACGEQARCHLDLFANAFPVDEVACHSRRLETAERFAATVRSAGYVATAHETLRGCIDGADIIVSSSPGATGTLIDPCWLDPGCFISLVDLGRSMRTETLSSDDRLVVDDEAQFTSLVRDGVLKPFGSAEPLALSALLGGEAEAGSSSPSRTIFLPTGLGAIDVAIAWELVKSSRVRGVGMELSKEPGAQAGED